MDVRTAIRELDELIRRMQSVIERQSTRLLAEGVSSCDYRACAATYQSFNAADCTYQPYGGGARHRCLKGTSVEMSAREPSHPSAL